MEDINGVSCAVYLGPTFSINRYDQDGNIAENGIFLHYGHTMIKIAKTVRGFKAHIDCLKSMIDEIEESL